MHSNWHNMPFPVNEESVFAAVKTADAYGRHFRDVWKKESGVNEI